MVQAEAHGVRDMRVSDLYTGVHWVLRRGAERPGRGGKLLCSNV